MPFFVHRSSRDSQKSISKVGILNCWLSPTQNVVKSAELSEFIKSAVSSEQHRQSRILDEDNERLPLRIEK